MGGIHRSRPVAADIRPARPGQSARSIGDGLWMSEGTSNSYAIEVGEGRVVVNAGLNFEGPAHRAAYDAVCAGPTRSLVFTQGHPDHVGGHRSLTDPETRLVAQARYPEWRDDHHRLSRFRARNAAFAWGHTIDAIIEAMRSLPPEAATLEFPEPDVLVQDTLTLDVGDRRIELIAAPGGETTDSLVVWLPDDRTLLVGNLFGPLLGHVPNLVTMRGDRYRDPLGYVAAANLVLDLAPETLVTGHFEPLVGTVRVAEEVTALRDSTQWLHDEVVAAMEDGTDLDTLVRDIALPSEFDIGEGYGKTSWNARAIWEMYAGWFHHRSTTELYGVPAAAVAADIVAAAGAAAILEAAHARITAGQPVEALHLAEIVLNADASHEEAIAISFEAHALLFASTDNFWERAWLSREVARPPAQTLTPGRTDAS